MTNKLILLREGIYVDTAIFGDSKKTWTLQKACVKKRAFIRQLVPYCFKCTSNILNGSRIYCIDILIHTKC